MNKRLINQLKVLPSRVYSTCPNSRRNTGCKTITPLLYYAVNQLLIDLIPFVGDVLLAHLLQTACLQ